MDFKQLLLKEIPEDDDKYESIIGNPLYINQFKFTKFIKKGFYFNDKKTVFIF